MELQISFIHGTILNNGTVKTQSATSYSKWKIYKRKRMDKYMKNVTVSHYIDRIIIKDAQITSKNSVDDMIEFLKKARESLIF